MFRADNLSYVDPKMGSWLEHIHSDGVGLFRVYQDTQQPQKLQIADKQSMPRQHDECHQRGFFH